MNGVALDASALRAASAQIDAVREHGILSSLAGFPILIVFACTWFLAGALSYVLPRDIAPWVYVFIGAPAMPLALWLERRLGYLAPPEPDPLLALTLQLLFVQVVAFPAIVLVWDASPHYVPVAFAAIVGAHFLPFQWVYRTALYAVLGIAVALGAFVIAVVAGRDALHYTGFYVGAVLFAGALFARAHARARWVAAGRPQRSP